MVNRDATDLPALVNGCAVVTIIRGGDVKVHGE